MSANDVRPLVDVHGTRVWKRFFSKRIQIALDVLAVTTAFVLAYVFRFDFVIPRPWIHNLLVQLPWVVVVQIAALFAFGVYNLIWRYVGLAELRRFVGAAAVGAAPLLVGRVALPEGLRDFRVPVSITLMGRAGTFSLRKITLRWRWPPSWPLAVHS